jgi:hypothetical protein
MPANTNRYKSTAETPVGFLQSASGIEKNYLCASQGAVSEIMIANSNCEKRKEVP